MPGIDEQIRRIIEVGPGKLWLGTRRKGVLRVDLNFEPPRIERLGETHGLPPDGIYIEKLKDQIVFTPFGTGPLSLNPQSNRFEPLKVLGPRFESGSAWIYSIQEDPRGNAWFISGKKGDFNDDVIMARPTDKGYELVERPFRRLREWAIYSIYPESENLVWFGGPQGIIRYDRSVPDVRASPIRTLIRAVKINADSTIFGGYSDKYQAPVLSYRDNALRIEYASTAYLGDPTQSLPAQSGGV